MIQSLDKKARKNIIDTTPLQRIGKPEDKNRVIEYVLGKPSKEDKESIFESINLIINEMDGFFTGSSSTLMNKLNGDNK